MRNRLAHESSGPDLSYDDAESVLNPLTRLLERLGYPEAATSSRIVRSELVGSPRSVRGVVTDSNRGWVRPARRVWFTAAAVAGIATLGALVVLWSLRRNDGGDPSRPLLPQTDADFVDTRGGWGWGDKCWTHLKAGKLGGAKAECDEGMKMHPAAPQPRASLLYNEGLLAQAAGNIDEARMDFTESLLLRENQEVRQALTSLPAR